MFYAHGLVEEILLKCLYYSKQPMDSMQSLPKLQWHFKNSQIILKFVWNHKKEISNTK